MTCTVLAATISLLLPVRYTASLRFVPETATSDLPAGIAGLAGQFGLSAQAGAPEQSPQFYTLLLGDRAILSRVLASAIDTGGATARVLDVLRVRGDTDAERIENGIERLSRITERESDLRTNVVTVSVTWKRAEVAAAIANQFLQELGSFNLEQRSSSARRAREFLESQVVAARSDLHRSEDSLQAFLERNRRIQSPELLFVQQRLQRSVDLGARLLESLEQQSQQARIREVNTTPVVTVLRNAEPPAKRSFPLRRRLVMAGALLGTLLGAAGAFAANYVEEARRRGDPDLKFLKQAFRFGGPASREARAHGDS